MKILLAHNYYAQRGGEDVCADDDIGLLRMHGHDVHVYSRDNREIGRTPGVGKFGAGMDALWSRRTVRELSDIFSLNRPDLVHVHNFFPLISPAIFHVCRRFDVPVIHTLHNFRMMCANGLFYRDGKICEKCARTSSAWATWHRCYRDSALQSMAVSSMIGLHDRMQTWKRTVDQFIALTESARALFVRCGIPDRKIVVNPNYLSVDPAQTDAPRSGAVFVGRLSPEKGVEMLLEAWCALPDIPLTIVGEGPCRSELEAMVKSRGLTRVRFLGFCAHAEVLKEIGNARILVMPSQWYETFGRTMMEAFAMGTPVVASRIGSMSDLVEHDVTGLLFDHASKDSLVSAVRTLIASPDRLGDMGRAARQRYEARYTPQAAYDRYMGIYSSLLNRNVATRSAE